MKRSRALPMILMGFAAVANSQSPSEPTTVTSIGRFGISDEGAFQHYGQTFVQKGRLIPFDAIWVDQGKPGLYREGLVGAGGQLIRRKRFVLTEEGYYVQATGPKAKGAGYALFWTKAETKLTKRLSNDTVWFIYVPLRGDANTHWVIDRARLNYDLTRKLRVSVGFAGSKYVGRPMADKPFADLAYRSHMGTLEFWAQHLPVPLGWGAQIRWVKTFSLHAAK